MNNLDDRLFTAFDGCVELARHATTFGFLTLAVCLALLPYHIAEVRALPKKTTLQHQDETLNYLRTERPLLDSYYLDLLKGPPVPDPVLSLDSAYATRNVLGPHERFIVTKSHQAKRLLIENLRLDPPDVFKTYRCNRVYMESLTRYEVQFVWCCYLLRRLQVVDSRYVLSPPLSISEIAFCLAVFDIQPNDADIPTELRQTISSTLDVSVITDMRGHVNDTLWDKLTESKQRGIVAALEAPELQARAFDVPVVGVELNPSIVYWVVPTVILMLLVYVYVIAKHAEDIYSKLKVVVPNDLRWYVAPWPEILCRSGALGKFYSYLPVMACLVALLALGYRGLNTGTLGELPWFRYLLLLAEGILSGVALSAVRSKISLMLSAN